MRTRKQHRDVRRAFLRGDVMRRQAFMRTGALCNVRMACMHACMRVHAQLLVESLRVLAARLCVDKLIAPSMRRELGNSSRLVY